MSYLRRMNRVKVVTSNYSVNVWDCYILCDASSSVITVSLPSVSVANGLSFYLKKVDSTGNRVDVVVSGGGLIDGVSTYSLNFVNDFIEVKCSSSGYVIF